MFEAYREEIKKARSEIKALPAHAKSITRRPAAADASKKKTIKGKTKAADDDGGISLADDDD
jgi:hypothetical protein